MGQTCIDQDTINRLQDIYSRKLLIPVIGSGLSVPFGIPDWGTLIKALAVDHSLPKEKLDVIDGCLKKYDYWSAIDEILSCGISEICMQREVANYIIRAKQAGDIGKENNYEDLLVMAQLRFITTNYDRYVNDVVGAETFWLDDLRSININEFSSREYDSKVIPIHGDISKPDNIIFTRASYDSLYHSKEFEREFQHLRNSFTFLFLGFSFDDIYFRSLFDKMIGRFESRHYILLERRECFKNQDKIKADGLIKREIEEELKPYVADYADMESRIAWNRFMMEQETELHRAQYYYLNILKLYVANMRYSEAEEILEEMIERKVPMLDEFKKIVLICFNEQNESQYIPHQTRYSSDNRRLDFIEKCIKDRKAYEQPYFGRKGQSVLLSMEYIILLYRDRREAELNGFEKIYLAYSGLIQLQDSLLCQEDSFLRHILNDLQVMRNLRLVAPEFEQICRLIDKTRRINYSIE